MKILTSGIETRILEGTHVEIPAAAIMLGEIVDLDSFREEDSVTILENEINFKSSEYAEVVQLRRKGNNDFVEMAIRTKSGTYKVKADLWKTVTVFRLATVSVFNLNVGDTIMLKYELHPNNWDDKREIAVTASDVGCSAKVLKISKNSSNEICKLTVALGSPKPFTFKIAVDSMVEVLR